MTVRRPAGALLVTIALVAGGVGASTAVATTGPAAYVAVNVKLQDTRIVLSRLSVHDVTYVDFIVRNAGKVSHNFQIGGVATKPVKPGQTTRLVVAFPAYGKYRFSCTIHPTPTMSGWFQVDRPVPPG
jgi:plastocyanin